MCVPAVPQDRILGCGRRAEVENEGSGGLPGFSLLSGGDAQSAPGSRSGLLCTRMSLRGFGGLQTYFPPLVRPLVVTTDM